MTDEQLISGLGMKDPAAFQKIFERYYALLCSFANEIVKDAAAAEDLVTETFVKLWIKKREFNSLDHLEGFLRVKVKYAALNYLDKHKKRAKIEGRLFATTIPTENEIETQYLKASIIKELYVKINSLPERTRLCFTLTYLEGHSRSEVAKLLDISENTVRNLNQYALKILRLTFDNKKMAVIFFLFALMLALL